MTQRPLRRIGLHNIKHIWKKKMLLLRLIVIETSCRRLRSIPSWKKNRGLLNTPSIAKKGKGICLGSKHNFLTINTCYCYYYYYYYDISILFMKRRSTYIKQLDTMMLSNFQSFNQFPLPAHLRHRPPRPRSAQSLLRMSRRGNRLEYCKEQCLLHKGTCTPAFPSM
jgi:hypothetical protein